MSFFHIGVNSPSVVLAVPFPFTLYVGECDILSAILDKTTLRRKIREQQLVLVLTRIPYRLP